MRVQILGCGGYFPNDRRETACYFLPDSQAVFDAGTGTSRLLDRLTSDELDVFLTHAHLDHIVGLTYLLLPFSQQRLKSIRLYGTERTLNAVRTHLFSEPVFPVMPDFDFRALESHQSVELCDGSVLRHHPLPNHPGGTTAFRVDWPSQGQRPARSLAYVTDTVVDDSYAEFVQGVDVLIHECYFPDELAEWAAKTGHSHTTPVATLARDAGVGRLYLVHTDPGRSAADPIGLDAARALFPATALAEDLMEVSLEAERPAQFPNIEKPDSANRR
jgi:ribonuclease BN (tRNA processing enzyme)